MIWQIRYKDYGVVKYCYTKNFNEYYACWLECKKEINVLNFKPEFYEKMYQMQTTKGINGLPKR